jgi:hypothetical protein
VTLLGVVWLRNPIIRLEVLQSLHATSGLVRNQTTDGAPEDLAWSSLVEGTSTRLDIATLAEERQILQPKS